MSDDEMEADFDENDDEAQTACALCGQVRLLTFHHLIPRQVHKKKRFKREYTRAEMRTRGLMVCRICHDGIHDLIPDEKRLAREYNTLEKLLEHEGVAKHVAWSRKQR
jgi:5-methylcytosine-specific restriction endonuclease McrA